MQGTEETVEKTKMNISERFEKILYPGNKYKGNSENKTELLETKKNQRKFFKNSRKGWKR